MSLNEEHYETILGIKNSRATAASERVDRSHITHTIHAHTEALTTVLQSIFAARGGMDSLYVV